MFVDGQGNLEQTAVIVSDGARSNCGAIDNLLPGETETSGFRYRGVNGFFADEDETPLIWCPDPSHMIKAGHSSFPFVTPV